MLSSRPQYQEKHPILYTRKLRLKKAETDRCPASPASEKRATHSWSAGSEAQQKVNYLHPQTHKAQPLLPLSLSQDQPAHPCSYMAKGVQVVVCQLQLLERDQLPHPVGPGGRRVWVDVKSPWHGRLSLPRNHPTNKAEQLSSLGSGEA